MQTIRRAKNQGIGGTQLNRKHGGHLLMRRKLPCVLSPANSNLNLSEVESGLRRCKPKSEQGCGEKKALADYNYRLRVNSKGRETWQFESWCHKCSQVKRKLSARKYYNKNRDEINRKRTLDKRAHTGPKRGTPFHLFACGVKPCER